MVPLSLPLKGIVYFPIETSINTRWTVRLDLRAKLPWICDTAEIRLSARVVTSILFSGFDTKWRIHGLFSKVVSSSRLRQETQYLASILTDTFVKCIRCNISCAQENIAYTHGEILSDFHWAMATNADQWKWRQRRIAAVSPTVGAEGKRKLKTKKENVAN